MFDFPAMPWLEPAPDDFRRRCTDFVTTAESNAPRLTNLASYRTDSAKSRAFAKLLDRLQREGAALDPLLPTRIAVLGSGTLDVALDALPIACARHGIAATIASAEFDQIVQTALNPQAVVFSPPPDVVLVQFDHRWLGIDAFVADADESRLLSVAIEQAELAIGALRDASNAQIVVTNVAVPPGALFGSLDASVAGTLRSRIAAFNGALAALARDHGGAILDVAALAEQVGTARWFDPVRWNQYKMPFAADCSDLFADTTARLIAACRGKARKCLVLDCDNTLWGGVIGDDGIDAIKIGNGDPEGECFLSVQRLALDLKQRGIILAVCSKNFDHVAIEPFRDHPAMLLREADIAVFQANWEDKASNLEAIARTLNIGIDSLVFLDDNAAERAQVRQALPLVAVPELPADPAYYALYLASAGYFEAISFSSEDGQRAASYAANAQRAAVMAKARDLESYLDALDMTIDLDAFDEASVPRIAQLINKSNQFNLTTRRYSEAEVRSFARDERAMTLQVRLRDKFSDFGMIAVVIARDSDGCLALDSWLMSCRVLGRRVEHAMINTIVALARDRGCGIIRAEYIPTAKNAMVAEFYDQLGFAHVGTLDGVKAYELELCGFDGFSIPFRQRQNRLVGASG